jgi:hypothetical protein
MWLLLVINADFWRGRGAERNLLAIHAVASTYLDLATPHGVCIVTQSSVVTQSSLSLGYGLGLADMVLHLHSVTS